MWGCDHVLTKGCLRLCGKVARVLKAVETGRLRGFSLFVKVRLIGGGLDRGGLLTRSLLEAMVSSELIRDGVLEQSSGMGEDSSL